MDFEAEYNNRARVPNWADIFADWRARSARLRGEAVAADLGIPYGPTARQILDIIWPDTARDAPVVLFIHGGYWQYMHPRDLTFAAEGLLKNGIGVALAGYDLAPDVPLDTIVSQARSAAVCLTHRIRRRFAVTGHSAGGHLAACLTATSWSDIDPRVPDDIVPAGAGISGVYEVEPLVQTSLNDRLHLTADEARRLSPALWPVPKGRRFETFTGGLESAEFLRQGRDLASGWAAQGAATAANVVEGTHHFTVVEQLADPASPLVACLADMARNAAAQA